MYKHTSAAINCVIRELCVGLTSRDPSRLRRAMDAPHPNPNPRLLFGYLEGAGGRLGTTGTGHGHRRAPATDAAHELIDSCELIHRDKLTCRHRR
jgi:hypothetical protein